MNTILFLFSFYFIQEREQWVWEGAFLNPAPACNYTDSNPTEHAIPKALQGPYTEELERIMLSTHAEVFERIVNIIRSGQPGTFQPSETSSSRIEQHVNPVNPGDARPEGRSPMNLEELGGAAVNVDNENMFDLPGFPFFEESMG